MSNSNKATFAAPSTLSLGTLISTSPTCPPGSVLSMSPSLDQDLTGEIRELTDITFNPDIISFESLLLLYLQIMLGVAGSGMFNLHSGGLYCAVFCHDTNQVLVASKVCQNFPDTGLKIVKSSSFQLTSAGTFMENAALLSLAPPGAPSIHQFSDMLSPSSVPISEVSYDRSLTGMISVDGSTQGSPLFNTLDLNISSLMASPLFNPSISPEPLGSQIKGDGTSLLIAKAHITANAVDSLAEQVKSLTLKILPEAEAIKSIQRLEQAAGRDPLIGTNISITIAGLSGTSPSSGTVPGMQGGMMQGSATQSNRSYSPALSVKTDSSGGSSEGVTPNPSITVGARPIKVPKTKKKTGSGSKKPTYLQSRSKDGWHLQSYFKLDSNT